MDYIKLDGPALKIKFRQKSPQLFPFKRISRIHLIGKLSEGLDILLECVSHQIPISFFTLSGKLQGQLYGPNFKNQSLSYWLDHLGFDDEIQDIYKEWLNNQSLFFLAQLGFKTGIHHIRLDLVKKSLYEKIKDAHLENITLWLFNFLKFHFSSVLVQYDIHPSMKEFEKIMTDVVPLFETWIIFKYTDNHLDQTISPAVLAAIYQKESYFIEYHMNRMITQLASEFERVI
jgi:hypothetical protein